MNPTKQSEPDGTPLKADIVNDIPMHAVGGPAPIKDGEHLDKLMQDVGHELKKDDEKPTKHHLFSRKKSEKQPPKLSAQLNRPEPPISHAQQPAMSGQLTTQAKSTANKNPKSYGLLLVIIVTIFVTGALIAGTVAIYSK